MAELPLVLFAHDATAGTMAQAAQVLDGVARVAPLPRDAGERAPLLPEVVAFLVGKWRLPQEETPRLRSLRFVQRIWAGAETLPFRQVLAHHPHVVFAGNPGPNAPQVAEHAVALYLACAKRLCERDAALRDGKWLQEMPSLPVAGSTVGIVGWGAIGRRVGRALSALGADVLAVNRTGRVEDAVDATSLAGLRARLPDLDAIILTLPLTDRTVGLVDGWFLDRMRPDAVLVNVARGRIIDEQALYQHLVAHPMFRAGLDVWWHYPDDEDGFEQAFGFGALPNVVMSPHCAFNVPGARDAMVASAAENVARFLRGAPVRGVLDPAEHAAV